MEAPRDADAQVIQDLVTRCLERAEDEGDAAIEAILAAHPEHASAVQKLLQTLRGIGLLGGEAQRGPREFPDRLGDFRLLQRLGSGGMGVVYLANQESLNRLVAVKLIRPEHL